MTASFRVGGVLIENGNEVSGNNLPTASTSSPGVVQLSDSTSSSSTAVAATANAVSVSYTVAATAQTDATQAIADAATAQSDASQAIVDSSTAQAAANAAQVEASQAISDAASAQAVADAALPATGGVLTGPVTFPGDQVIPTTNIATASTSVPGIVQLNDTTASTSTTEALTANQGKLLQEQINALSVSSNIILAGTIDASTGNVASVTAEGVTAGFTVGSPLPSAVAGNDNYFAIVTVSGTMTPPAGSSQVCHQGDWWMSDGSAWVFLDVGFNATAATTSTPGVVQLATNAQVQGGTNLDCAVTPSGLQSKISDSTSTTSATTIASSTAVKAAFDAATVAASTSPLCTSNVLFVNSTSGNNSTAQRSTAKPFATLTAALAAASEGDFIYIAPGTYTENPIINKGVTILGTFQDQGTWQGTKILGNTQLNLTGSNTRNCSIYNVYFISANSTPPFDVIAHSTSAGNTIIANCMFTQQTATDVNQFGFRTAVTNWVRAVYTRNCAFDGNVKHNAGTAAGASGYLVMDNTIGTGSSNYYYHVLTGTVEFRNPSQALSPIFQAGGVVSTSNVLGFTNNSATTTTIFGGTGFNYKGSAASVGTGTVYFGAGYNTAGGKVDIGANLVYGWTNLNVTPANLTVNGSAVAYTAAVPSSANAVVYQQTRPGFDLLKTTSPVTAANQTATVVDGSTGIFYSVSSFDAGTY